MAVATFVFGDDPKRTMEVRWSVLGFEEYLLDGQLLEKRWDMWTFSGERVFVVDGKRLRIVHHISMRRFYSKVYLDDELIVPELFPEIAQKLEKMRGRRRSPFVVNVIVWTILGLVGMYGYSYYQSRQTFSQDCPKPNVTTAATNAKPCS